MTSECTEQVFSATAATYDTARARLIPGFSDFYSAAVSLLPEDTDHVLGLGAGTGLLSSFIRERLPNASLHLVDNSEPMLTQARLRFGGQPNITCELADYTAQEIPAAHYDAIVSALSIHHLTDPAKQQLFTRILPALKPGGLFLNAEQILQPTPALEAAAREQWLDDIRALAATEQQVADSLLRQTEDRCAPIEVQLQWLREAGFTNVRCVYAQGRFAVLAATR